MPWWRFFAYVAATWVGINALFAVVYMASPDCILNARPGDFEDAFYFSVQTLATIGYGTMSPATRYGHIVVVVQALVGTLGVALVTGATFAKFARPTARVLFSNRAVVQTRDGVPHLVFRLANWRGNMVVEGRLRVSILLLHTTREGDIIRNPVDLPLVRDQTPLFALTWMAMHRIDERSPFWGGEKSLAKLDKKRAQVSSRVLGAGRDARAADSRSLHVRARRHRLERTLCRRALHRRRRLAIRRLRALSRSLLARPRRRTRLGAPAARREPEESVLPSD